MLKKLLILCGLALLIPNMANAVSVLPLTLDEIVDDSATAFQGICTGNRTEFDPVTNFIVTYTTFEVRDVIKGTAKATHTIKQIGGTLPSGEAGFKVQGVPKFTVGAEYVVFLAGVSSAGFSSPIGLSQGKFTIQEKPAGKTVSNGRDFRDMKADVSAAAVAPGESLTNLGLDEFKQLTRKRAGNLK